MKGRMFRRSSVYFAVGVAVSPNFALQLKNRIKFGGGHVVDDLKSELITHVVILSGDDDEVERQLAAEVRMEISSRRRIPRIVTQNWLADCWEENTLLDEERYAPV
jgi:DNA ligase-4